MVQRKKENMLMPLLISFVLIELVFPAVTAVTYTCSATEKCGCSLNPAVLTKIVGGEQAGTDTWGWAVSIRANNAHFCGGTLISSTLVLSAAHCFASLKFVPNLSINVGSKYLSVIRQQRSIAQVFIPKSYNPDTFVDDVAILRLSSPVDLRDRSISLLCLPEDAGLIYPPDNSTVVAIGWGTLESGSRIPSNTLQQVTLNTLSSINAECRRLIYNTQSQFCAGVQRGGKGMMMKKTEKINRTSNCV